MKKQSSALISKLLNKNSQPQSSVYGRHEEIVMRDVRSLVPNPKNKEYSLDNIEELATMIQLTHNIEPIILKAGTLMITSGHRRRLAHIYRLEHEMTSNPMVPTIEREIINDFEEADISDDEMETLNIVFPNKGQRRHLTPSEEAAEIEKVRPIAKKIYDYLKKQGQAEGKFRAFFADFLDVSQTSLVRKESINKLSEEVKKAVDTGEITSTAAFELSGLSKDEQDSIVSTIKDKGEKITVKAVVDEKKELREKEELPTELMLPDQPQPAAELEPESELEPDIGPTEKVLEEQGQTVLMTKDIVDASVIDAKNTIHIYCKTYREEHEDSCNGCVLQVECDCPPYKW